MDHDGLDATMIWCWVSIVQRFDSLKEVTFINDGDGPIIIASNIIEVLIGNNGLKKNHLKALICAGRIALQVWCKPGWVKNS